MKTYDPEFALVAVNRLLYKLEKGSNLCILDHPDDGSGIICAQDETKQGLRDFLLSLKERLEREVTCQQ